MEEKNCGSCKYYENIDGSYICKNDKSERHEERTSSFETCDEFRLANAHTMEDLRYYQSMPLDIKISMTRRRIRDWIGEFGEDGVYVSFSGGKDSTVLLDIVRKDYPNVQAVFVNTGLEYPSVRKFAESKENVVTLRPKMNFREVVTKYGYPIISKEISNVVREAKNLKDGHTKTIRIQRLNGELLDKNGNKSIFNCENYKFLIDAPFNISEQCCDVMKKKPFHNYDKSKNQKAIIATMTEESRLRQQKWIEFGCNAFNSKKQISKPMSFWTERDVLTYIHTYNLIIADAYGQVVVKGTEGGQMCINDMLGDYRDCKFVTTGCKRTGCVFCLFGCRQDLERIHRLQQQEPKMADYVLRGGAFDESDGMWKPTNDGMGYWFILDWLALHGIVMPYDNADYYRKTYGNEQTRKFLEV